MRASVAEVRNRVAAIYGPIPLEIVKEFMDALGEIDAFRQYTGVARANPHLQAIHGSKLTRRNDIR